MPKHGKGGQPIKGSWSEAEDETLAQLTRNGEFQNWSDVARSMTGRTAKQCRERWVQNLRPGLDHSPLRPEEGRFVMELVGIMGKKWAEIARRLEGAKLGIRSDNTIKNWFNGNINRVRRAHNRRENAAMHQRQRDTQGQSSYASVPAAATLPHPTSFSSRQRALPPPAGLTLSQQRPLPPPMSASPTTPASYYEHDHHYHQHHYQQQQQQQESQHHSPYAPSASRYGGFPGVTYTPSGHDLYSQQPSYSRRSSTHTLPSVPDLLSYAERPSIHPRDRAAPSQPYYPHGHQQQRFPDRRASAYTTVDSPRSDMADHHYAPSLVSDNGSPSVRESPMHAPVSPNTVVPSVLPPLAPVDDKDAHDMHRSPTTMSRTWSNMSDEQYQHRPTQRSAPRPASSGQSSSSAVPLSMMLN
ncbi:hypothetical protein SEUCBS140593_010659 [Sporothrix eucalyptigena]|uniref:Uncharacterized protein n=1 Tax=Sporothrix eucalyptigena TaxID=1812306 RepID=A0ABP0D4P7_9PEZI